MPLRLVLDEHLRGTLWRALQQHNASGVDIVDVTRVGDPADLPLGTQDPDLLLWAEREQRVVVTMDRQTMLGHLAAHLQSGHHSPGVFLLRPRHSLPVLIHSLVTAVNRIDPTSLLDQYRFLP